MEGSAVEYFPSSFNLGNQKKPYYSLISVPTMNKVHVIQMIIRFIYYYNLKSEILVSGMSKF